MNVAEQVIAANVRDIDNNLFNYGVSIGKIYTDFGLPIDMALERIEATKEQKIAILSGAQNWLIEHRRNSNATDKAIERQRKINLNTMTSFINTGESGIY